MNFDIPNSEEEPKTAKTTIEKEEKKETLKQWEKELIEKVEKIKTEIIKGDENLINLAFIEKGTKFNIHRNNDSILVQKSRATEEDKFNEFVFNSEEKLVIMHEQNYTKTMLVDEEGIVQDGRIWTPDFKRLKASPEKGNLELPDPEVNPLKARTLEGFLKDFEEISPDKIEELKNKGIIKVEEK